MQELLSAAFWPLILIGIGGVFLALLGAAGKGGKGSSAVL